MQAFVDKARVLVEALPFISRFRGRVMVVKVGGRSLEDAELRRRFAEDIVLLHWVGVQVVVVHGGGKQISDMLEKLSIEARFVDGLRVTDVATLEVVEMVLGGQLNQEIVRQINALGGKAIGLTGKDAGMACARVTRANARLGLVGDITAIDTSIVERALPDFIPVIAPLAVTEAGETLNVNADAFAAALAGAMNAEKLVLLTDVEGVLGADGKLISSLTPGDVADMIADGTAKQGMIPKLENAVAAIRSGVGKVHIIDGTEEHALLLEIYTKDGVGSQLVGTDESA